MKKTGAIYIRVSTGRQEELSPDAQLRLLKEYAEKNDIYIPSEYIFQDNGISGRKVSKRPAFQQMIGLAKSPEHPIDVIIVWKFSRFARNQEESIVYKSLLKKSNVDVVSISENVEGEFGSLIERIIEWMDEYYSIRLGEEVVRGMTEKAMRGQTLSAPPIGYLLQDGKVEIDPVTSVIPLTIKDMYLAGYSLRQISDYLNEHGYRTKRGNRFDTRGVLYIIENPIYYGMLRWNYSSRQRVLKPEDEVIYAKGYWEPLWDEATYKQMQARRKSTKREFKTRDHSTTRHWLTGLVKCSTCGGNLTAAKGTNGFQCWKYAKGLCHDSHYISVKNMESNIISGLEGFLDTGIVFYTVISTEYNDNSQRIELLQHQLSKLQQREKRAKDAYLNGIDTIEEYKTNRLSIQNDRQTIQEEIQILSQTKKYAKEELDQLMLSRIQDVVTTLKDETIGDIEKGNSIRTIVDQIIFDRKNTSFDFVLHLNI